MKKEVEVKVPERTIKATTKKVETVFCDVCGEKVPKGAKYVKCCLCGRDCHTWWYSDMNNKKPYCSESDPRDYGDYPDKYCRFCYDLKFTGKYDKMYEEEQERHWKFEEDLDKLIKKESLAHGN